MLGILGGDDRCPIARSLDVLGEKWTLLIVRDALAGRTRFGEFQSSLGIPRDVLTARLGSLVEGGVLERRDYKPEGGRRREEYVLTESGRDLALVLLALGGWADRHRPASRLSRLRFLDSESEATARAVAITDDGVIPNDRIATRIEDAAV
jgi:DNA-binding HxlR family transcriptional regulator